MDERVGWSEVARLPSEAADKIESGWFVGREK